MLIIAWSFFYSFAIVAGDVDAAELARELEHFPTWISSPWKA